VTTSVSWLTVVLSCMEPLAISNKHMVTVTHLSWGKMSNKSAHLTFPTLWKQPSKTQLYHHRQNWKTVPKEWSTRTK
jgi:hypothetical protein